MKKTTTLIAAALFGCTFVTNAQDGKKEDTRFASPEKKRSYAIGMFFGTRAKSTQKDGDEFDRDALIEGLRDVLEGKKNLDYASGVGIGQTLKRDNMVVDVETLSQALKDVFSEGGKTKLTEEESRAEISMLQQELQEKRAEEREMEKKKWEKQMAEAAPKNEASGKAFLAENGKKEGVKTTGSGLQYKILKEGEGKTPGEKDRVSVIYKGMLLDGTVFDDSQGKPRSFGVNRYQRLDRGSTAYERGGESHPLDPWGYRLWDDAQDGWQDRGDAHPRFRCGARRCERGSGGPQNICHEPCET